MKITKHPNILTGSNLLLPGPHIHPRADDQVVVITPLIKPPFFLGPKLKRLFKTFFQKPLPQLFQPMMALVSGRIPIIIIADAQATVCKGAEINDLAANLLHARNAAGNIKQACPESQNAIRQARRNAPQR